MKRSFLPLLVLRLMTLLAVLHLTGFRLLAATEIELGGGVTMQFIKIPAGVFTMGPSDKPGRDGTDTDDSSPDGAQWDQHTVNVSDFQMGRTEVTQLQYQAVMTANPSHFTGDLQRPVEQVSWFDAVRFCNKLSLDKGFSGFYSNAFGATTIADGDVVTCNWTANGFRLPTEAEWEYACRAGTSTAFYWGNSSDVSVMGEYCWYGQNSGNTTHPVGGKLPNAWSLFDMTGNVGEWCWDWYEDSSPSAWWAKTNPMDPAVGFFRVVRGSAWDFEGGDCRSRFRCRGVPTIREDNLGFRLVKSLP